MPVTHQEIAEKAGVSRALVTRALHRTRHARVSPETRLEILKVARQLGYQPRNFTTHNIGYVGRLEALNLSGENRLLLATDRTLRRAGYRLMLTSLDDNESPHLQEILNPKTVDGVIFTRWFEGRIRNSLPPEIPWVVVSDEDEIPSSVDKVTMDAEQTAYQIVTHLTQLGHERIGILANPSIGNVTTHLHMGVRRALCDAGLREAVSSIEVQRDAEIAPQLATMMRQRRVPTAFVAFGAEKAVTLLNQLNALGLRVPQDVSIVSLLDSILLEPLSPSITATTALGAQVAERAVARLLEKINDPGMQAQHILIPGEIIHRQSVAPVKGR